MFNHEADDNQHTDIARQAGQTRVEVQSTSNTVIGLLRLTGHDNIAAALRHHARDPHRPIKLLMTR